MVFIPVFITGVHPERMTWRKTGTTPNESIADASIKVPFLFFVFNPPAGWVNS
jgi:hypothetical protein